MELLQSIITFIPKYLSGMILLFVYLILAASWVAGIFYKLLDNKLISAFLSFIFPPYGIGFAWITIYKEESLKRKIKG